MITKIPAGFYRLTLSQKAMTAAVVRQSSPLIGCPTLRRPDGKFEVAIRPAVANLLKQLAEPGENLSDTVIRILGGAK
jgi:hypothetical protein